MNKTLLSLAAAAVLALGFAGSANAATAAKAPLAAPAASTALAQGAQVDGSVIQVGRKFRRFGHRHNHLWKYDYRPRYVCKKHYRWVFTRYGWRNVYVGYWCDHTNNY